MALAGTWLSNNVKLYNATITYNTATTVSTCDVWHQWVGATYTAATTTVWNQWSAQTYVRKETKKQAAERRARQAADELAYQERLAAEHDKAVAAEAKANKLLVEHLSDEQRKTLAEKNYFDVQIGEKTYRIHRGTHGNVRLLDTDGKEKTLFCVQPSGVPVPDCMLAQKLHLEADEPGFLRAANARPIPR